MCLELQDLPDSLLQDVQIEYTYDDQAIEPCIDVMRNACLLADAAT